jgi:hypothetical protein
MLFFGLPERRTHRVWLCDLRGEKSGLNATRLPNWSGYPLSTTC